MDMSTRALVSLEEYLATTYEADREYVDGEIVERNVGEQPHRITQRNLALLFDKFGARFHVHLLVEIRLRIGPTRYRIADVAVWTGGAPPERVPAAPPYVIAEVLSSDDRLVDVREKLDEYHQWGVKHIWLADPWSRRLSVYEEGLLRDVSSFELPEFDLVIRPSDLFE